MAHIPTRFEALLSLLEKAGDNQSALARALGVSQPAVWCWINQSKQLPAEHVLTAERLYGVSRHDLRPDIYPRNDRFYGVDQGAHMILRDRAA